MVEPKNTNNGQADEKSTVNSGNSAVGGAGITSDLKPKKPKTIRQIERERARRKRRREKKAKLAHPIAVVEVTPQIANAQTDADMLSQEQMLLASVAGETVENEDQVVEEVPEEAVAPEIEPLVVEVPVKAEELPVEVIEEPVEEKVLLEEVPEVPVESDLVIAEPLNENVTEAKVEELPDLAPVEQIPEVIEELPVNPPDSSKEEVESLIHQIEPKAEEEVVPDFLGTPEPIEPPKNWIPPMEKSEIVHEEHLEEANTNKAKEIAQSLLGEETHHLEDLTVKQGLFGKFFDWISSFSKNKKVDKEVKISVVETTKGESPLSKINFTKIWPILKNILGVFILIALIVGAFWLGSSLKLYDRLMGLFAPQPGQIQLVKGDNAKVIYDADLLKKLGFETGRIFAKNSGNLNDLGFDIFFNANYFGKLNEPVFYGETGISAAIYYGFGKDIEFVKNRFIFYVTFLHKIDNANTVNIHNVLNGKLKRDEVLTKYIFDNRALFDEGNKLRKEINVQIDDLKISVNSVTPDKDKFQTDFFASLSNLNGEQANVELAKFIEISQKLVEIKAKLAAMTKLSENYQSLLIVLKDHLDIIEKNQQALISGVPVTELP